MIKGRALRSTSGWATPEVEAVFASARQLCQELDEPPELFPVLCSLAHFHMIRGNLRECRDRADALIVQAEHAANPAFLMAAHHLAGVSREFIGEMVESSRASRARARAAQSRRAFRLHARCTASIPECSRAR